MLQRNNTMRSMTVAALQQVVGAGQLSSDFSVT
jgi:hypothetical protein